MEKEHLALEWNGLTDVCQRNVVRVLFSASLHVELEYVYGGCTVLRKVVIFCLLTSVIKA